MSDVLYPSDVRGLTFTVTKRPTFDTLIQPAPSKHETRIAQTQNPIWHWLLIYDYLYASSSANGNNVLLSGRNYPDMQLLMGFWLARKGQFDDFLFEDPDDKSVGPAMIEGSPNLQAELIVVEDSDTGLFYSPIQRNMGGQFREDITDLNGEIVVYANGVLQEAGVDYNVGGPGLAIPGFSFLGKYLVWADEYEPEGPITVEFNFYFRARFASDEQDFEKFVQDIWTIGGHGKNGRGYLELISARPPHNCEEIVAGPPGGGVGGGGGGMPGFWVADQGMKGGDATFERSEFYYNTDDYDEGERHFFGGVVSSNDPVGSHECYILDSGNNVVGTITVPPNVIGEERQLLQPQEWFPLEGEHQYKCRMGDFGSNGNGLPGIGDATWAPLICEPRRSAGWTKARLTYDLASTLEQGPVGPDGEDKEDGTGYIGIAFDSSDIPESAIPPDLFQQRPERYGTFQRIDSRWANKVVDIRWETVFGWGGLGLGIVTTESFIHLLSRQEATSGFNFIASTGKGGVPNGVTTDPIDTTGANLIVLSVGYYFNVSNVDPVLSDNKGNTYTALPLRYAGDYLRIRHFYAVNPTVGANHTFTASPGFGFQNFACLHAAAFSGAQASPLPYDKQDGEGAAAGVSIKPTGTGELTPTFFNALVVTSICDGFTGPRTIDDENFTVLNNVDIVDTQHFGGAIAYSIQAISQPVSPEWSGSPDNGGLVAAISAFTADPGSETEQVKFHNSTKANVEEDPIDHVISSVLAETEDGGEYYVALTRADETSIIRCKGYKVQMQVLVSGVTAEDVIEFPYTISRTWADSGPMPIMDRRQPADLRGAVAAYFEITGMRLVGGGHTFYLYDFGTSDSGPSGARIAASALEFTADGRLTLRTGNILAELTHLNRYGVDYDESAGGKGWITGSAKLIIARQGGSVALPA